MATSLFGSSISIIRSIWEAHVEAKLVIVTEEISIPPIEWPFLLNSSLITQDLFLEIVLLGEEDGGHANSRENDLFWNQWDNETDMRAETEPNTRGTTGC